MMERAASPRQMAPVSLSTNSCRAAHAAQRLIRCAGASNGRRCPRSASCNRAPQTRGRCSPMLLRRISVDHVSLKYVYRNHCGDGEPVVACRGNGASRQHCGNCKSHKASHKKCNVHLQCLASNSINFWHVSCWRKAWKSCQALRSYLIAEVELMTVLKTVRLSSLLLELHPVQLQAGVC